MSQPARERPRYDIQEYLVIEEMSNVRHEYLDGVIYAMAGGTPEHGALAANVIALLGNLLRGRRCRVYTSDVRIRVKATGLDTYPDVSVVCGKEERDEEDALALVNPVLLVEVTSPSSENYDRGEKLDHYRQIPSLREVLLVSHREPRVTVWRRQSDDRWHAVDAAGEAPLRLESLDIDLALGDIFRDALADR